MRLRKIRLVTSSMVMAVVFTAFAFKAYPQGGITVYQYRQVSPDKAEEFVKRETTYWSEVAKKALAGGNLTFWALLEKVGGYDMANTSNYLFINTYNDIDAVGSVWSTANITAAFPNVPLAKMETNSLSKTIAMFFLKDENFEQAAKAVPDRDFKYVKLNYITSSNPGNFIALEKKHWAPFIKAAMDASQTTQVGWGNARILSPLADNIKANTVAFDLYSSLKEALNPTWDSKLVVPEGLAELSKLEVARRGESVYRIIKVVAKQP